MEFLFGTWISLQKFWYFERRMFGKYLEVFHLKIWANPLSSCKIIHQTISHTFLSFTISTHRPLVHLTYIVFKQTLQFLPSSSSFQTLQIVRPRLSNTSSNEFVLRSTLPMLPWQEQRDGCLNLVRLPLRPVVRWDDDLGQDEVLGADCIERTSWE